MRTIKNLHDIEEMIELNLANVSYQVQLHLKKLEIAKSKDINNSEIEKLISIFNYYKDHIIPSLKDSANMEHKHLDLIEINPDKEFSLFQEEFDFYIKLSDKFFKRIGVLNKKVVEILK